MDAHTVAVNVKVGVIKKFKVQSSKFKYNKVVPAFAGTHYLIHAYAGMTILLCALNFSYALWRLMASVISSSVALHGNIGSK